MTQTLSYQVAAAKITDKKREYKIEATKEECQSLAKRLDILEVSNVVAELILEYKSRIIYVSGTFSCDVNQECVVTLDSVSNHIHRDFEVLFYASVKQPIEDSIMDGRTVDSIKDGMINLGEIVSQQISLALPDFPKSPNAEFEDYIEAPDALEEKKERTHRPFADLLQGVTVKDDE